MRVWFTMIKCSFWKVCDSGLMMVHTTTWEDQRGSNEIAQVRESSGMQRERKRSVQVRLYFGVTDVRGKRGGRRALVFLVL
jgi:hypothetical protein